MGLRRVRLVMLMSWAVACGDDRSVCEEAAEKLNACKVGRVQAEQGYSQLPLISSEDCSSDNECFAKCVAPASCASLAYAVKGRVTDPNEPPVPGGPELVACIYACME